MSFGFTFVLVPVALGLFLMELYFLKRRGVRVTLDQTVLNLTLGFFDRLVGLYLTERALVLVHDALSFRLVPQLPENMWTFLLAFFAVDFMWYIFHVAGHRISLMWGIHLVHHQSEEYNLSVNFAISPLGFMVRSVMYSVLVVIGLPIEYVIMSSYLNAFYQYYLHTEFLDRIPFFERLFVVPAHHKVHHASNEAYLDKNYGGVFIIWDKLFGTYAEKVEQPRYGLTTALPHKDFINIQLFYFVKLFRHNFIQFGWKKAVSLLFKGPEHQTSDVPVPLAISTKIRLWKVIVGGLIYVVSYKVLLTTTSLPTLILVALANFLAIMLVNGIRPSHLAERWKPIENYLKSHNPLELLKNH